MTTKGKHLTLEDRNYIEDALGENYSLRCIAEHLGKDPTTISKEVKRNKVTYGKASYVGHTKCHNHKNCTRKHICSKACTELCKKCKTQNCYRICPDYEIKKCNHLMRFPHVCNGCVRKTGCRLQKYRYRAKVAHINYTEELKTSREGIGITANKLNQLDDLISPLILKGQPITHIYAHHKYEIECSERTLYAYFEKHLFTARNIDLPRKVKYKPRKKRTQIAVKKSAHRSNRTYDDFNYFTARNPEKHVIEMDTVKGSRAGETLLTLFFRNSSFMLVFLMEDCTQESVKKIFDELSDKLGLEVFRKVFPVILTDNGSEFKAPDLLEKDIQGNNRTRLFFCDPMASHQKARIEKNHTYIRYVLPKGKAFKDLTREKVNLMMNHINNTARASLNGNTPFKLAQLLLDDALLEVCSIKHIPADEVHLKPALLKA